MQARVEPYARRRLFDGCPAALTLAHERGYVSPSFVEATKASTYAHAQLFEPKSTPNALKWAQPQLPSQKQTGFNKSSSLHKKLKHHNTSEIRMFFTLVLAHAHKANRRSILQTMPWCSFRSHLCSSLLYSFHVEITTQMKTTTRYYEDEVHNP